MLVIALGTVFKIGIFIYIFQPRVVEWKHSSCGSHVRVGLLIQNPYIQMSMTQKKTIYINHRLHGRLQCVLMKFEFLE